MPVGGECYAIAQTVLQEDEEGTERAVTAAVYGWTDAGVEQIAAIPDYGERTEITRCLAMHFPSIKGKPA